MRNIKIEEVRPFHRLIIDCSAPDIENNAVINYKVSGWVEQVHPDAISVQIELNTFRLVYKIHITNITLISQ